jgi:glycosyltransferase involved in cell wall biosynthesis
VKVLILHSELGMLRGGGENFVKNLFTEFACRGHQIHSAFAADPFGRYPVALPESWTPIPVSGWWFRQSGQKLFSMAGRWISHDSAIRPFWDRIQQGLIWRNFRRYNLRFGKRIAKMFAIQWNEYDLVFVNDLDLALLAASHRPTMLWLAGPLNASTETQLRKVPIVSADGDAFLKMRQFLGEHITELSIGLDGLRFQPGTESERAALGWGTGHCVFGYVGRLTELKGADILAKAFSEISYEYPAARLLILGNGEADQTVRSTLSQQIADGRVALHPGVDHQRLPYWYRAMDVFVLPSRYENFSNALVEASACGIPFIASDIGGNRILSGSGGSGDLFEVGSVTHLVRCMREFIANKELKQARAQAFSSVVRQKYTWAASADRLEWILHSRLGLASDGTRRTL